MFIINHNFFILALYYKHILLYYVAVIKTWELFFSDHVCLICNLFNLMYLRSMNPDTQGP